LLSIENSGLHDSYFQMQTSKISNFIENNGVAL